MATSYILPRGSAGNVYVKDGKVIAFVGDPELYDGDWFRKTVTVTADAIIKAHIVETNYKSAINLSYDLWYDFSSYSGTWTLEDQSIPPFYDVGTAKNNWYITASIPTCVCHIDNVSVSPSNGKTFSYTPSPSLLSAGQHTYYNRLCVRVTNFGKWRVMTGTSYALQTKMIYAFTDGSADDYSRTFTAPTSFLWEKSNSLAGGHSVRGSYSVTCGEPLFSLVSGSFVVSA